MTPDSLIGKRVRVTDAGDDILRYEGMAGIVIDDDATEQDPYLRGLLVKMDNGARMNLWRSEVEPIEEERHD